MKKKPVAKKKPVKKAVSAKKPAAKEVKKPAKKAKAAPAVKEKETKTKATAKAAPVAATPVVPPATLGLKRTCPKCSTKFYDFGKNPILCPKCGAEVDPEALLPKIPRKAEQKKKAAEKVVESVLGGEEPVEIDPIETADDLSDDDDTAVEEIAVEEDNDDEF